MIDQMLRAGAAMAAVGAGVASDVPFDIFASFGEIANIPINPATYASANTTWTVQDTAGGYLIPDGTPVGLSSPSQIDLVGFETQGDFTVLAGSTTIDIPIVATDPGAAGSGLDTVTRLDALGYVTGVTVDAPTIDGKDAELTTDFVNRLAFELQVWTPTPILGRDFAIIAQLLVPGVYRAAALDNYNPADGTFTNEKMVAVSAIDANGAAVGGAVKTAIQTLLESMREWNFVCNVVDATFTTIDVEYNGVVATNALIAATQAASDAAVATYLNPANWGNNNIGTGQVPTWTNLSTVYYNKIIQAIENVPTMDRAYNVQIRVPPAAFGMADIPLSGAFPLPQAGTITSTVGTS